MPSAASFVTETEDQDGTPVTQGYQSGSSTTQIPITTELVVVLDLDNLED